MAEAPTVRAGRTAVTRSRAAVLVVVIVATLGLSTTAHAAETTYSWPVSGSPVAPFDAPASPYGSGHRGVDLEVAPGQWVQPMADGTVTFAGSIAGATWVTVTHPDGVRTSYGPLAAGRVVQAGQQVDTSTRLGRARGDAHGVAGRVHVGARRNGRYIDPATLVEAPMVATLVGPGQVRAEVGARNPRPVLVPGTPPSPDHLVVLAGLTSGTGEIPFDLAELGYGDGTWEQYSYEGVDANGDPKPYDYQATWGSVHEMALKLRDQLRAYADDNPGKAVDLMGHSLGGLVAMYYLLVLHDATDPTLPPIGRIVTASSPLQGTDSGDAAVRMRDNPIGRSVLNLLFNQMSTDPVTGEAGMSADMAVLEDLKTDSKVAQAVREAWARYREDPYASPLATGTDVLTVGSTLDPIVTEGRSGLPGAPHQTVFNLNPMKAHSAVTTNPRTEELLAAFMADEALPSPSFKDRIVNGTRWFGSGLIAGSERYLAEETDLASSLLFGPPPPLAAVDAPLGTPVG